MLIVFRIVKFQDFVSLAVTQGLSGGVSLLRLSRRLLCPGAHGSGRDTENEIGREMNEA